MKLVGVIKAFLAFGTLIGKGICLPDDPTDDQVDAKINAGTFQDPSANLRPRFRYWVPDASVDLDRLADDIKAAGDVGAGGVEVLGYYLYDSAPGNIVPTDWTTYGWGTPAWKTLFDVAIKAHHDNGLIMDFAMGPNQGQGVPAHEDDEGLEWDLVPFNASVPTGGSFHGTIPGWGTGKLQAVVSGLVTKSVVTASLAPSLPNDSPSNRTQDTLAADSLQDITDKVGKDGHLNITFPSGQKGLENMIFAIYLVQDHARNEAEPTTLVGPETQPQDFIHNGSWIVDHFSSRGAKVTTDFWDKYLLVNGTKEALQKVGNFAWEDSIEITPLIYWTPNLPQQFQKDHGYSINKWIPILLHQNGRAAAPPTWYITDEPDSGNSHIADYRTTLAECYGDYLKALVEWANKLDLQWSSQVSYNLAMDMQTNIPVVNAPECESLGFGHLIDGYRQYAGPANLAGKRIVSTECGANYGEAYQQTIPELLWDVKRSIAGSVNNFIFHGYPFSGDYGETTWPTFTTFTYDYSEMHGRHQPSWDFYSDFMDFTARLQYIFQSGIPKMDLAFYQKLTTFPGIPRNYEPTDLEQEGYSYEYINPDNLELPEAYVKDGVLAPERQAFKALIVRANDTMTVSGATRIAQIAHSGLPVIFSGGIPSYVATYNAKEVGNAQKTLQSLRGLHNVHVVPYEPLANTVSSLGIKPLTKTAANATWYTYWRNNDETDEDYVFVYNDAAGIPLGGGNSEGTVEFLSTGKPYFLDAWSGAETPIANYTQSSTSTTIFFQLTGNQSTIVAFKNKEKTGQHAIATSSNVLAVVESGSGLTAHVGPGESQSYVTTSDGKKHTVASPSTKPVILSNWSLVVEHWDPPSNLSDINTIAVKHNTTHKLPTLTSWQNIDGLQNVSGRGYYESTFQWGQSKDANSAIISFGPVVQTIRVTVNGHVLPPLDVTSATADISSYLVKGTNHIAAVVSTTLTNVLAPIWSQLETSGVHPTSPVPGRKDYGLLFPVVVTPYRAVGL